MISKSSSEFILFKNDIKKQKDINSTYLMDFQYVQIKNNKEGFMKTYKEINFFIINFPSDKIGEFILKNMLFNL